MVIKISKHFFHYLIMSQGNQLAIYENCAVDEE